MTEFQEEWTYERKCSVSEPVEGELVFPSNRRQTSNSRRLRQSAGRHSPPSSGSLNWHLPHEANCGVAQITRNIAVHYVCP